MEKPPDPSDSPTLVPENSPPNQPRHPAAQTLTPPPSSSDSPTLVPESSSSDAPTMVPLSSSGGTPQTGAGVSAVPGAWSAEGLPPGTALGGRYEILQALGEGGMGAVYKARDRELDRMVALKVIRPDLARNPAIIQRFKQELILARQVTHRNVVRIFDLGEADGIKFITMEFIEGKDLRSLLLEHQKFSPEEAAEIIRQVCLALDTAHTEGVIHRDLKPQNIMRDAQGRIVVMDFGLARSLESDGMTQTGALIGTMEYMSPEQGLGQELDQRSDLFTLGLIFYELLTGQVPYKAESALASLLKRTQERAVPISQLDSQMPRVLSNIVAKCLERDAKLRYATAKELLTDLEAWQGKSAAASIRLPSVQPWGQDIPWVWISVAAVVIVLAITALILRGKLFGPSTAQHGPDKPEVSLAILPFRNASGDSSLDWLGSSVAEMLTTDVGQSAHLRTVSPDRLHQVLSDLRITPGSTVAPDMLSRIAEYTSADTVVSGQFVKFGDQIRIDGTVRDLKHDRTVPLKVEGVAVKDVPSAVDRLAESIRQSLAVSPDVVKELKASSFQPTTKSPEALREYNEGLQLLRDGKNLDAVKNLQAAIKGDPQFALAYSRLAEADSALGYDGDADQYSRKAVDLAQQLPLPEKYLIEATRARLLKDDKKAIAAYENLLRSSPGNVETQFALASAYEDDGDLDKARANVAAVLKAEPNNISALLAMGRLAIKQGDAQAALQPLNQALSVSVQLNNQEQKALILLAMGIAYRVLNKPDDALREDQESLDINRRLGQKRGVAANLMEIAQVQTSLGKLDAALASYKQALSLQREIGTKKEMADTLIDVGLVYEQRAQYDAALDAYKQSLQMQRETGNENYEAMCLNNIGNVYLGRGDTDNALTYLQQALQLREKLNVPADIAETLHNLGETYAHIGDYDKAMSNYMRGIDLYRKAGDNVGAAVQSHAMALVFQAQGRYGAAVNAIQDALKPLIETGDKSRQMAEFLTDLGDALARAGRMPEAGKPLDQAEAVARPLKNESLNAVILNARGDVAFFNGDLKRARELYTSALRTALRGTEKDKVLISKMNLARLAVAEAQPVTANQLRQLAEQSDALGMRDLSLETSVLSGEEMVRGKEYARARDTLEAALSSSEKLGTQMQTAVIHYWLGESERLSGHSADAPGQYREAQHLTDEMKKEPGAEKLLLRADTKAVYEQAVRWSRSNVKK